MQPGDVERGDQIRLSNGGAKIVQATTLGLQQHRLNMNYNLPILSANIWLCWPIDLTGGINEETD